MNKQELINKLQKLLTTPSEISGYDFDYGHDFGIERAISLAEDLDEPEKPLVPKFVADYINSERNSGSTLSEALGNMYYKQRISDWFYINSETFAKAWLYGYEIKKEKLYTVEIPNPGATLHFVLRKYKESEVSISYYSSDNWRDHKCTHLTEAEIKKDFAWAWEFAEEV